MAKFDTGLRLRLRRMLATYRFAAGFVDSKSNLDGSLFQCHSAWIANGRVAAFGIAELISVYDQCKQPGRCCHMNCVPNKAPYCPDR